MLVWKDGPRRDEKRRSATNTPTPIRSGGGGVTDAELAASAFARSPWGAAATLFAVMWDDYSTSYLWVPADRHPAAWCREYGIRLFLAPRRLMAVWPADDTLERQ